MYYAVAWWQGVKGAIPPPQSGSFLGGAEEEGAQTQTHLFSGSAHAHVPHLPHYPGYQNFLLAFLKKIMTVQIFSHFSFSFI